MAVKSSGKEKAGRGLPLTTCAQDKGRVLQEGTCPLLTGLYLVPHGVMRTKCEEVCKSCRPH